MIVEVRVTLILDTDDRPIDAALLVERELRAKGLIAGRVCDVRSEGYYADGDDIRRHS